MESNSTLSFLFSKRFINFTIREFEKDWEKENSLTIGETKNLTTPLLDVFLNPPSPGGHSMEFGFDVSEPFSLASMIGDSPDPCLYEDSCLLEETYDLPMTPVANPVLEVSDEFLKNMMNDDVELTGFEPLFNHDQEIPNALSPILLPCVELESMPVAPVPVRTFEILQNINSLPRVQHRRKAEPAVRVIADIDNSGSTLMFLDGSPVETYQVAKVEDAAPATPLSSRTRKRSHSQASTTPVVSQAMASKRMKKYLMTDDDNPSVRNARAAKANRDKKKQELAILKEEKVASDVLIADLRKENAQLKEDNRQLRSAFMQVTNYHNTTSKFVEMKDDIKQYLGSILPGVQSTFGPVPSIILAPGGYNPERPQDYISSHFNKLTNHLTISNQGTVPHPQPSDSSVVNPNSRSTPSGC